MAQQGYPQQGYGSPEQQYPASQGSSPPPPEQPGQAPAGGKKRRQYAGQAYEFGAGGNTQPPAGAAYSGVTAGYDGYAPADQGFQQPGYQQPGHGGSFSVGTPQEQQQPYGQPQYQPQPPGVGGYQPPDSMYAGPGGQQSQSGIDHIQSGLSNMGIGGSPQPQPQQAPMQRPHLNQLHPTDMMNQPFHVSELDLPPPPIVLPPNVSLGARYDFSASLMPIADKRDRIPAR